MSNDGEIQGHTTTYCTEIVNEKDSPVATDEMKFANGNEIRGPRDHCPFKTVGKEKIPADANLLPRKFVLTTRTNHDIVKCKALFVIGEHCDPIKHYFVQQSQNIHPSTIRLIPAL